ncbi:MAG: O-antigen ligase family protein [Solirubrobacteraceae bacterium]
MPAPRAPGARTVAGLLGGALLFGLVAGGQISAGRPLTVVGLAAVLLPVFMWRRPSRIPAILLGSALLVEQFANLPVATHVGSGLPPVAPPPATAHIPLFRGIGAVHLAPADVLLAAAVGIYLAKTSAGSRLWPRSPVAAAVGALSACVLISVAVGVMHHGQLRVAFMEARPLTYVALAYVATSVLTTSRAALVAALWGLVLVVGVKSLQGIYGFIQIRHMNPRPEAVLGHEDSFFFALFAILVAALWLFGVEGRLRRVATWLLPLVLIADLANNRRAAWLVLCGGLLVLTMIALRCLPTRRILLWRLVAVVSVFLVVYLPAFWNKSGGLAQPARALHSMVSPDPRDALSDKYRIDEDANLKLNIAQAGPIGKGYGVPIDYALPIEDISDIDPFIAYVPHDGILYVLMRLGLAGGIAFWALLGTGILSGVRLARTGDRMLAVVGALLACALVGYALQGAVDQGFFFYRIAIVMGVLLGLAEAGHRLAASPKPA